MRNGLGKIREAQEDEEEESSSSVEEEKDKEMYKSMKEIIEEEERERKRRLIAKRKTRLDYSENIIEEIDCENLSNLYERSKKEYRDFVELFYCHGHIPSQLFDDTS